MNRQQLERLSKGRLIDMILGDRTRFIEETPEEIIPPQPEFRDPPKQKPRASREELMCADC